MTLIAVKAGEAPSGYNDINFDADVDLYAILWDPVAKEFIGSVITGATAGTITYGDGTGTNISVIDVDTGNMAFGVDAAGAARIAIGGNAFWDGFFWGDAVAGTNTWLMRAYDGNFGTGTVGVMELLFAPSSGDGRLVLLGNATSNAHLLLPDGNFAVFDNSGDADDYVPTHPIEHVANGGAPDFAVDASGFIRSAKIVANTNAPGANTTHSLQIKLMDGTSVYVPCYSTEW